MGNPLNKIYEGNKFIKNTKKVNYNIIDTLQKTKLIIHWSMSDIANVIMYATVT